MLGAKLIWDLPMGPRRTAFDCSVILKIFEVRRTESYGIRSNLERSCSSGNVSSGDCMIEALFNYFFSWFS